MKKKLFVFLLVALLLACLFYKPSQPPATYTMADVEALVHTERFYKDAIMHIFDGTLASNGSGSGYHYNMIENSRGAIIAGTKSKVDHHGVYTANVTVDGIPKSHYSTFFPDVWSPQQVVDAINIACDDAIAHHRNPVGDTWVGYYEDIEINLYLTRKKKLIMSAFPIYEGSL